MASFSFTTAAPCQCCTKRVTGSLQCRTQGGSASLKGFAENSGYESTPPKRYLTITGSGTTFGRCRWNSGGLTCNTTQAASDAFIQSGTRTLNPTLNTFSGGGTYVQKQNLTCPAGSTVSTANLETRWPTGIDPDTAGVTTTQSATNSTYTATGACYHDTVIPTKDLVATGSIAATISNEDTEAAAITRLIAATSYSAWATCVTGNACCIADYEQRTSSVTFSYHDVQVRAVGTITASTFAYANIYTYRRPWGTVTATLFSMEIASGTSTVTGYFESTVVQITNTEGYETYAQGAFIL